MDIRSIQLCGEQGILTFTESGECVLRHDGSSPELIRQAIDDLKVFLLSLHGEQLDLRVEHLHCDGMYLRKLHIPKGTLLVGKIHLKDCLNIVAKGEISVLTEFGCALIPEGETGVSLAGTQKVGYAHEDTVFINVFRAEATSIEDIERLIACDDRAAFNVTKSLTDGQQLGLIGQTETKGVTQCQ